MKKNKLRAMVGAAALTNMPLGISATNIIGNKFEGGTINNKVANNKNDPKDDS